MTTKVTIKNESADKNDKHIVEVYQVDIISGKRNENQPVILQPGDATSLYVYANHELVVREADGK